MGLASKFHVKREWDDKVGIRSPKSRKWGGERGHGFVVCHPRAPPAIIYLGFHFLEGYPHTLARDSDPFALPTSPSRARRTSNIEACSKRLFSCVGNAKKTSTRVLLLAVSCAPTKLSYRCFSNISSCLVQGTVGRRKIEFRYVSLQSMENYRYVQESCCTALIDNIYHMLATQHPPLSEGQTAAIGGTVNCCKITAV